MSCACNVKTGAVCNHHAEIARALKAQTGIYDFTWKRIGDSLFMRPNTLAAKAIAQQFGKSSEHPGWYGFWTDTPADEYARQDTWKGLSYVIVSTTDKDGPLVPLSKPAPAPRTFEPAPTNFIAALRPREWSLF